MERIHDTPPPPERIVSSAEKLRSYLATEQVALGAEFENKQKEKPPEQRITITPDFRIVPPPALYGPKEKDIVERGLVQSHGSLDATAMRKDENERAGFMFEVLKTSIMHKKLGERFIVVRSSYYDDLQNGVDNVIVDRQTGYTICALDEVSPKSMHGTEAAKKRGEIEDKNFGYAPGSRESGMRRNKTHEQGMTLKYGIELQDGKISCAELHNLPIFLLSLDHEHLNQGMDQFQNSKTPSKYEGQLYRYFLSSLSLQIQGLKLKQREYEALPQVMRDRIESLETFLRETDRK